MAEGDTLEFLAEVRRHGFIPSSQVTYTDAETLATATSALRGYVLPKLMSRRGEFYFGPPGRVSYAIQEGVDVYRVPSRAVGSKIRSARLLDRTGTPYPLATYEWDDVSKWPPCKGIPTGLSMEGASVRLYPTPQGLAGYTLEIATYVRPAALVLPSDCAQILASGFSSPGVTDVVVSAASLPESITTDSLVDVVLADSPFESVCVSALVDTVAPAGPNVTLMLVGTYNIPVGSWLCVAGTSPVVQLPLEWQPMLCLKTAATQLASLGDIGMSKAKLEELAMLEANAGPLVTPRREDAARKVSNGMNKFRGGGAWGW